MAADFSLPAPWRCPGLALFLPVLAAALAAGCSKRPPQEEPVRAVTPGQAVVFYDGERVLGGGWIEQAN